MQSELSWVTSIRNQDAVDLKCHQCGGRCSPHATNVTCSGNDFFG